MKPMNPVAPILQAVLARIDPARARALRLRERWAAVVGPALALRTRPRLEGGTVVIEVEDERWAIEMRGLDQPLRQRLAPVIGEVERLVVVVRAGPALAPEGIPAATVPAPPSPPPADGPLPPALAAALAGIADQALRERFARTAATALGARDRRGGGC